MSIRRLIAGVATAAVTAALVTVSVAPAAQAAGRPTDFAFTSFAYGTKVKAAAGELRSGRTAPSWIGCTRQAGKVRTNEVLGVDAPTNNPLVQLGAITSRSTHVQGEEAGHRGRHREHLDRRLAWYWACRTRRSPRRC